jgi:hypothetical protein
MLLYSIPALVVATLVPLAIYKLVLYPAFISPLAKVPNAHWSAPFSPLWILWTRFRCRENRKLHAAHLKSGPVIRLAPNELSINDVSGLRTVYAGGFEKGQWYSIFDNYGYSLPSLDDHQSLTESKGTMHVLFLALPSTLCTEADDL